MEIFNIGFGEIFFILLLALIVLGPQDMVKAGRNLARLIRRVTRSTWWGEIITTSRQLRDLPARMMREANLEENLEAVKKTANEIEQEIQTEINKIHLEDGDYRRWPECKDQFDSPPPAPDNLENSQSGG